VPSGRAGVIVTWTPRSDVSVDYLRHYFGSEAGVESLASASPGSAGRNRTLSIKNFEQVLVPVPSRPDQDRIVAHLGRHTRPGRDDGTLDALVAGFTARGIEESPLVPFGSLLQLQREPVELVDGERYRRIGIYSWGKGMLRRESASANEMGSMRYFTFPIPSLVFSNNQAWEGAVALASPEDGGHVCSSRFYPYVPREGVDVDLRFLLEFFRSDQGIALMRRASPGTQVRNKLLSRSALEMAVVPFPGRTIQDRIVTRRQMVGKATDVIKRADELADAILPAARNEIFNAMR